MKRVATGCLLLAATLLAACENYPRDIGGTLARVTTSHSIRVGIIEGSLDERRRALALSYLGRLRAATGAEADVSRGAAEPLLARLEAADLDLVIGEMTDDTPWLTAVAVIEPLAEREQGERLITLNPVARNGENRWIMLLEREVRNAREGA